MQLLRNADLYDPQPKGRASLLIGGERILWIGDELELPANLGATVRDLEGRRVIPGLIDCHVHLTGGGGEAGHAHPGPAAAAEPADRRRRHHRDRAAGNRRHGAVDGRAGGDGARD